MLQCHGWLNGLNATFQIASIPTGYGDTDAQTRKQTTAVCATQAAGSGMAPTHGSRPAVICFLVQ